MRTFQDMYTEAADITGDSSATTLVSIKGWINQAKNIFNSSVRHHITRESRTANIVAAQQYYQLPRECIRPTGIVVDGDPMIEIKSEQRWREVNSMTSSGTATHFFIRGAGEIGLWPIPSASITSGLEVYFETKEKDMTQADYTTGTVTVANGDQTIVHSAGGFTASMVGRYFSVTDGTDGFYYKIGAYTDVNTLELENVYEGASGAAKTFKIGESTQIPEEYQESLIDYACYRYYMRQKDDKIALEYKMLFEDAIERARMEYAPKTTSRVIASPYNNYIPNIFDQDFTVS